MKNFFSSYCPEWRRKRRKLRNKAYKRQNGKCYWCGQQMLRGEDGILKSGKRHARALTAEHLIPQSQGGKDTPENVVAACNRCNNKRGAKLTDLPPGGKDQHQSNKGS